MIPRPQGSLYCSVHNGNLIPVAGRYLLVAAWYYGGTSVIDFTNPSSPHEIAYYDPEGSPTAGEAWSAYWYNGKIYTNDIRRGQDVFNFVLPSSTYGATFTHLNAQTQEDLLPSRPRDAGPVTAAQAPPPRRPDGPVGPPGTPSTRYCSSTRVAFASPRLTK